LDNPKTQLAAISETEGEIIFLPTRPAKKPDKGFLHNSANEAVKVPVAASNQVIVTAYEMALNRCG